MEDKRPVVLVITSNDVKGLRAQLSESLSKIKTKKQIKFYHINDNISKKIKDFTVDNNVVLVCLDGMQNHEEFDWYGLMICDGVVIITNVQDHLANGIIKCDSVKDVLAVAITACSAWANTDMSHHALRKSAFDQKEEIAREFWKKYEND